MAAVANIVIVAPGPLLTLEQSAAETSIDWPRTAVSSPTLFGLGFIDCAVGVEVFLRRFAFISSVDGPHSADTSSSVRAKESLLSTLGDW